MKAVSLSLNTIVIVIIVLLVLVLVAMFFTSKFKAGSEPIDNYKEWVKACGLIKSAGCPTSISGVSGDISICNTLFGSYDNCRKACCGQ